MSNDYDTDINLGGRDSYISLSAILRSNAEEERREALERDISAIGEIPLFAGKSMSAWNLNDRGLGPKDWRWALHKAETALGAASDWRDVEPNFVKDLISLGRRYAVLRYARWEMLSFSSALTATFPHGIRALLDQFLGANGPLATPANRLAMQSAFKEATVKADLIAYERAGLIRAAFHQIACDKLGPEGHLTFDREGMRAILSLCRLHYSASEIGVHTLRDLHKLDRLYENARSNVTKGSAQAYLVTGKKIHNWQMRHLHPLTFFYPYSIRNALARGIRDLEQGCASDSRSAAANELALARCAIETMRRNAKVTCKSAKEEQRPR